MMKRGWGRPRWAPHVFVSWKFKGRKSPWLIPDPTSTLYPEPPLESSDGGFLIGLQKIPEAEAPPAGLPEA